MSDSQFERERLHKCVVKKKGDLIIRNSEENKINDARGWAVK